MRIGFVLDSWVRFEPGDLVWVVDYQGFGVNRPTVTIIMLEDRV